MRVIGVTGGVGSGKSLVLSYLKEKYGAELIFLDDLGRKAIEPGGAGYEKCITLFGCGILLPDGTPDRKKIAEIVFNDREMLERLDGIVHPAVKKETLALLLAYRERGKKFAAIEGALLFEEHYDALCDEMWYVRADEKTRRERLSVSRGYSDERISAMFAAQMSDREFAERCDFIVENSGDFELAKRLIDERLAK